MSVWLWALVGLAATGALLLLVLAIPLDLRLRFAREERTESSVHVRWLFGLLRKEYAPLETGRTGRPQSPDQPHADIGLRDVLRSGLVQHGVRSARRLWRTISVRELRVRAAVNAGDPAETGMTFALIGPACGFLALAVPKADVAVVPDFGDAPGVRGELRAWIRVIPIVLLFRAGTVALSPTTWRGIARLRRGRS